MTSLKFISWSVLPVFFSVNFINLGLISRLLKPSLRNTNLLPTEPWKWTASLIRKNQIKATMGYHLTIVRMAYIKINGNYISWWGWVEEKISFIAGGNAIWYNNYKNCLEIVWRVLKKLKIELPYDPTLPLSPRTEKLSSKKMHAHRYLLQHSVQYLRLKITLII